MAKKKKSSRNEFHIEFKNEQQEEAWDLFKKNDILFLIGPAGTGKSYLSMAFAASEIIANNKRRVVMTRPIVESGESLGFLPGDFEEKVDPYMAPLYDNLGKLIGYDGGMREQFNALIEVAPLAYLRGRSFDHSICVFDEAQNASVSQFKLFLTRMGNNCKMVITGDPQQYDVNGSGLLETVNKLKGLNGVGVVEFNKKAIVRNPLIGPILERLES